MEFFWDGIKAGLALSVLVGPILFAIVQTSIEQGFRAGLTFGLGIWSSDLVYILAISYSISQLVELSQWPGMDMTISIVGGLILLGFGVNSLLMVPPQIDMFRKKAVRFSSYPALWLKGFLINGFNPFTVTFWILLPGILFTQKNLAPDEAKLFCFGILMALVATDSVKIALAKFIRKWLKPANILLMRKVIGGILICIGTYLLLRIFL